MTPRAVWAAGVGQCVSWGVLYYAFSVLIVPIERDLGVAQWVVVGAFSLALLVSATVSPSVGRLVDRGHGPLVVQAGGLTAAGLLALWALAPSVWLSYLVWAALGLCMAAILYEPVFAIVGRSISDAGERLRAIATITVFGGFAGTVFLPLSGVLVEQWGWRWAVVALAAMLALTTLIVHRHAFSAEAPSRHAVSPRPTVSPRPAFAQGASAGKQEVSPRQEVQPGQGLLMLVFTLSSFASVALATNLVPALIEREMSATTAATFGGLFGVMQVPGRLLFMQNSRAISPMALLTGALGLQVAGLMTLAASRSFAAVALGIALFASGSGLATLARPYLVLVFYGPERAGQMNGLFARPQQLARAAGPVGAAAVAAWAGYSVVFAGLAAILAAVLAYLISSSERAEAG